MNPLFRKVIISFLIIFLAYFFLNFKQTEPAVKPHPLATATALCCSSKLPNRYGIKITTNTRVFDRTKEIAKSYNNHDAAIRDISFWFNASHELTVKIKPTENRSLGHLGFSCIKDK
ncbi:hypothetical protein G7074_01135 [Pedobacter sp. HDW13]|uniref:hypothetical protein n=1 Tax=unclassified Pedobacter TaxID=2628915 RepID=UPI000F5B672C|nr:MULTISPECIES: hypothetical protein [unclassified Pedobacter]QIL38007.1 hypothetical protein G7074_01135 [Pedobacter sp. HDW13]RQO68975.1 hypothetical protein DBR40_18515 [Pedobacter sp. KBW01]